MFSFCRRLPLLRPSVLLLRPRVRLLSKAVLRLLLRLRPRVKQQRQRRRTLQLYVRTGGEVKPRGGDDGCGYLLPVACVTLCVFLMLWVQRLAAAVQARDAAVAAAADSEVRLGAATQAALAGWNTTLLAATHPRGRQRPWWLDALLCIAVACAVTGFGITIGKGPPPPPFILLTFCLFAAPLLCLCLPVSACVCLCVLPVNVVCLPLSTTAA